MNEKYINYLSRLPLSELIQIADRIREDSIGARLDLCAILNAKSGLCSQDCKFCSQSAHHKTKVEAYPLKKSEEIVKAARRAKYIGAGRFGIVTSGNRLLDKELNEISESIKEIRKNVGIKVCASLGELSKEQLLTLKKAGLSRYHHNIESSPRYFKKIVREHTFSDRLRTIKAAKAVGLEVCSGGIIGMGETFNDRLQMALILKELGVDSVPINILVPIKGTPLENIKPLSPQEAIRTIAIFRIILKDKTVKIAAGRESALKDFQGTAFMAGANGMIIGGYLTIKGNSVKADHKLIKDIKHLWTR